MAHTYYRIGAAVATLLLCNVAYILPVYAQSDVDIRGRFKTPSKLERNITDPYPIPKPNTQKENLPEKVPPNQKQWPSPDLEREMRKNRLFVALAKPKEYFPNLFEGFFGDVELPMKYIWEPRLWQIPRDEEISRPKKPIA